MNLPARHTATVKQIARKHGFDFCGIAKADFLEEEAPRLEAWLKKGMHGQMAYMGNHFDKRLDPRKLVEGAQSVIVFGYNYFPAKDLARPDSFKIAKYAYGKDYHHVIKAKLRHWLEDVRAEIGAIGGRIFVDSAPVLERPWAAKAGIGWVGKNSLLLNRNMGSFFFLAEFITDLELLADNPMGDFCGTCTRCMDACPTEAIPAPYVVDGSKCISYLSIELKDAIPPAFKDKMEDWIFGCDICQDVCPWNRFSRPHQEPAFLPHPQLPDMRKSDWLEITEDLFRELFRGSAVKRTKYEGLTRNIRFADS